MLAEKFYFMKKDYKFYFGIFSKIIQKIFIASIFQTQNDKFSNRRYMIIIHTFENLRTMCKPGKDNEYQTMTPLIMQLIYAMVTISGEKYL